MISTSGRTVLLNPGPVNVSPRVVQTLLRGDLCHREREFAQLQTRVRELPRRSSIAGCAKTPRSRSCAWCTMRPPPACSTPWQRCAMGMSLPFQSKRAWRACASIGVWVRVLQAELLDDRCTPILVWPSSR